MLPSDKRQFLTWNIFPSFLPRTVSFLCELPFLCIKRLYVKFLRTVIPPVDLCGNEEIYVEIPDKDALRIFQLFIPSDSSSNFFCSSWWRWVHWKIKLHLIKFKLPSKQRITVNCLQMCAKQIISNLTEGFSFQKLCTNVNGCNGLIIMFYGVLVCCFYFA